MSALVNGEVVKINTNKMKLNNRQIEAIASEILETLKTKRDVVIKDWEDNVYPGILKSLQSTKSYKDVVKLINNPLIKELDLDFSFCILE